MTYHFNGDSFETMADFMRAYPAYRACTDFIKAGVSTVDEMEKAIKAKRDAGRKATLKQAKANNVFQFSKKAHRR